MIVYAVLEEEPEQRQFEVKLKSTAYSLFHSLSLSRINQINQINQIKRNIFNRI
jgi:hypothetical protein